MTRSAWGARMTSASASVPPAGTSDEPIVQYIVLRKDLRAEGGLGWPLVRAGRPRMVWGAPALTLFAPQGSVVAQACHAAVAAVWLHREDGHTASYCSPERLDSMRKARECVVHIDKALTTAPSSVRLCWR